MTKSPQIITNPIILLLILIGISAAGLFISQFLALVVLIPISGLGLEEFLKVFANPVNKPEMKVYLLLTQLFASVGGFILAPLYFIKRFEKRLIFDDFNYKRISAFSILIAVGLTLSFIIVDSVVIEWNMNLKFPDGFHQWAREKEDAYKIMIEYLTQFDSLGYFLLAFITVAIVPAIGEELLFRGLIQKYLQQISGKPHIAIWVTAFLFSAFHVQFFGFFPRMFLGILFGYLFYFSGNLIYAILGHFINNGLTILMLYLYQKGTVTFDIENTESFPLETVGLFAIIGIVLFILYMRQFAKDKKLQL